MSYRRTHGAAAAGAVLALVGLLVGGAASVSEASAADGNWWFSAYHVADAHNAGWTGKGVKVAVIDGQIDAALPVFQGRNLTIDKTPLCENKDASVTTTDPSDAGGSKAFHGSSVASLIIGNGTGPGAVAGIAPDANLTFYGYGVADVSSCQTASDPYAGAINTAVARGAKIISISIAGEGVSSEAQAIADALAAGVIVVAAQPNILGTAGFPSDFNGVVAVNSVDSSGQLQEQVPGEPNVEPGTTVVAAGVDIAIPTDGSLVSGSSSATPLVAGMLADVWQKYPKATANQLIQSLIRNTSTTSNPNGFGYGFASLTKMLAADPMQYPSVNPLMNKASGAPTQQQVDAAVKRHAGSGTAVPGGAPVAGSPVTTLLLVGVVVLGVLILAGMVILIIMLSRRSRKTTPNVPPMSPWGNQQ